MYHLFGINLKATLDLIEVLEQLRRDSFQSHDQGEGIRLRGVLFQARAQYTESFLYLDQLSPAAFY